MAYTKTVWVNNQEPSIDATNLNHMEQGIYDAQFPSGGDEGQVLAKGHDGLEWVDLPDSAQWGNITGQISEQTDLYSELESKITMPSGGTAGQVLTKTASGQAWQDASGGGSDENIAHIETSSTASQAYAIGDYLVYNGQLYVVTAAISSGQTLTVGTNISATTVGSELTALNNDLTQFITYRNVQKTVTIPASGIIYDQTLDIPTVSGYKAFAIGGWHSQGGGYADSPFTRLSLNETTQKIEYAMMTRNPSETTLTIRIKVLYIRSNWVNIPA